LCAIPFINSFFFLYNSSFFVCIEKNIRLSETIDRQKKLQVITNIFFVFLLGIAFVRVKQMRINKKCKEIALIVINIISFREKNLFPNCDAKSHQFIHCAILLF
jgi:hypothetical protein